jgi:hypothetical protein
MRDKAGHGPVGKRDVNLKMVEMKHDRARKRIRGVPERRNPYVKGWGHKRRID